MVLVSSDTNHTPGDSEVSICLPTALRGRGSKGWGEEIARQIFGGPRYRRRSQWR